MYSDRSSEEDEGSNSSAIKSNETNLEPSTLLHKSHCVNEISSDSRLPIPDSIQRMFHESNTTLVHACIGAVLLLRSH